MRSISSILFVLLFSSSAVFSDSPVPERRLSLLRNMDFPGGDFQTIFDTGLNACEAACLGNRACAAFTHNSAKNACFLKAETGESVPFDGAYSGRIIVADQSRVSLGQLRAKDLDFLTGEDLAAAHDLALELTNKHIPNDWTAGELLQAAAESRASGNADAAYKFTGAATVLTDAGEQWLEYARLGLLIGTNASTERWQYLQSGLQAAINAYLRADSAAVQSDALIVIARALENVGRGRTMIPALRLAQSLSPGADAQNLLDSATGKYGFRIVDHTIDNDAAQPRICAEFSEDLVGAGTDYTPFVQLPDTDRVVEIDQRQLCILGVEHGKRYQVTFRQGLPAASGETLAKNFVLNLYVRDRTPAAWFPGRAYVLPANGNVALPIETVNVTELELTLRQISERSVLRAIQENYFGRALSPWEEDSFGTDIATTVWTGTGQVDLSLNQDVTTRLPLTQAVGPLEAGVYALQAKIPGADPYETPAATQWFVVSDLGLATLTGTDGLHVFLRSLVTAEPASGVEITLLSRANAVLGAATTDSMGYARFEPGLTRGTGGAQAAMVLARTGTDLTFLSLTEPEFDLSDRGVQGREPAGPIDAFLTTDRGAYRAGEIINATVLVRDADARAIDGLPLVAVLSRPDGVEYSRQLSRDPKAGGHVFVFPTAGTAPRGSWRLEIFADTKAPAVATTRVLIEDFLPERIDFDLSLPDGLIGIEDTPPLSVDARYLFGPPAADLPIEGEVLLRTRNKLEAYPGYRFGRYDINVRPETWYMPAGSRTDADGKADFGIEFLNLESSFRPLEAIIAVRIAEASGRPAERRITVPVAPAGPIIGIRPEFDGTLAEGADASFDLIALDAQQRRIPMDVRWSVSRVNTRYQWYRIAGDWNWEPITTRTLVAEGKATLGSDPVSVSAPVKWGRYEIKVERTDGDYIVASADFNAGWFGAADATTTPDLLELSLDAPAYAPGETARLRVVPRYPGKALVTVVSNRLIDMKAIDVGKGENIVDLPVTDDWGAGVYVTATVIRPTDADANRNPTRALGLSYASVDPKDRQLSVSFETEATADPRGPLAVAVKVKGIAETETGWVTIAAVDLGILNLTGFKSPDPSAHYFGQRKLGVGLRDVYGRLIDGMNGSLGVVRSGGDAVEDVGLQAPPPTEELVAYFAGPIQVDADGYARTSFDLPSFNGTVRLMAVAWSGGAVGAADTDVLVRDPVVITASLPRFMAPGDNSRLLLEFVHTSGPAGQMALDITTKGVRFNRAVPSGITLESQGRTVLSLPFITDGTGLHEIDVAVSTAAGKVLTKRLSLPGQVNDPIIARTSRFSLASGDAFTLDDNIFSDLRLGTGSATISAGPVARLDIPGLLKTLDLYPYGCTEQITSRALPLLYLDDIARAMGLEESTKIGTRIDQAIAGVLTNQTANGAFGLWYATSGDFWLDAYVTDFLSRARSKGYAVSDTAFRNALDNLRNQVNYAADFDKGGEDIAYALYVLAREGAASIGDLRYYADVKGADFGSPLSVAQLGAALSAYGDRTRADRMFTLAVRQISNLPSTEPDIWRADYGTNLRDRAAVLTLAVEAGSAVIDRDALLESIAPAAGENQRSTQEQVWTLLAANAMLRPESPGDLTLNGIPLDGTPVRLVEDKPGFAPLTWRNVGRRATTLSVTSFGVPEHPVAASGTGYAIERRYFTMKGDPISPERVRPGDRMVAVLQIKPIGNSQARLMVNDPLPAGFEIDNPNLIRGGDITALDWLNLETDTEYTEFRQERFLAAIDWRSDREFRLGYVVRAVTPGDYYHPAASVEDMYRPQFRAQSDAGRVIIGE